MNLKSILDVTDKFIKPLPSLVNGPNSYKDIEFAPIVEGTFRRDYLTLQTIIMLSKTPITDHVLYANSCMDLSRRVFEDMVTLEYMISEDKDRLSVRFKKFKAVEAMRDLNVLKAGGGGYPMELEQSILEDFNSVKNKYKNSRTPFGLDVDRMMSKLVDVGRLQTSELSVMSHIYTIGCRTNHFSPTDIFNYLHQDLVDEATRGYMEMSLLITLFSFVKITDMFVEELLDVDSGIVNIVKSTWAIIATAHETKIFE